MKLSIKVTDLLENESLVIHHKNKDEILDFIELNNDTSEYIVENFQNNNVFVVATKSVRTDTDEYIASVKESNDEKTDEKTDDITKESDIDTNSEKSDT